MKRVAVLGGGPAGAMTAECLASAGLETIVLDEKLAWEKPCGGAITFKAYREYPFLLDNGTPKRLVQRTVLADQRAGEVAIELSRPLVIYERKDLNGMMLERAARAGARVEKTRVTGLERTGSGWRIRTKSGVLEADCCVAATGARNGLKDVGTEWRPEDTTTALGYFVAGDQEHAEIQFFTGMEGYLWVFPRPGRLQVGICAKGEPARTMRARLEAFMDERAISRAGAEFFAHAIPALEPGSWAGNRVAGDGWLAVGDAAGLVDPVTGEGLYYAFRSGDLAAQALLDERLAPGERAAAYRRMLESELVGDLAAGARLARRFFRERILLSTVPARMISLLRRSRGFRELVGDLFAGTQGYRGLKRRLLDAAGGSATGLAFRGMLALHAALYSRRGA